MQSSTTKDWVLIKFTDEFIYFGELNLHRYSAPYRLEPYSHPNSHSICAETYVAYNVANNVANKTRKMSWVEISMKDGQYLK